MKTASISSRCTVVCQSVEGMAPGVSAASRAARAASTSQHTVTHPGGSEAARLRPIRPQPTMATRTPVFGVKMHCNAQTRLRAVVLPLQRVFDPRRSRVDQAPEFGLELLHLHLHLPGDFAVAEVSLHTAAQTRNILRLREVHLEQEARAGTEGQQVFRASRRQAVHHRERGFHCGGIYLFGARFGDQLWSVKAQIAAVCLAEFLAA